MGAQIINIVAMVKKLDNPPNRLREIRKAYRKHGGQIGLTLQEVADQLGTNPNAIARLETGERDLTVAWMRQLARVYRIQPADMLNPEDNAYALDDRERQVIDAMRLGDGAVADALAKVAENLSDYHAGPERKRA